MKKYEHAEGKYEKNEYREGRFEKNEHIHIIVVELTMRLFMGW